MSFYGSPRHLQLAGNLSIITTLQKQLDDLLLAWSQPNGLFLHSVPPFFCIAVHMTPRAAESFQIP